MWTPWAWLVGWRKFRRRVHDEATQLIGDHGEEAFSLAYDWKDDETRSDDERHFAHEVLKVIAKRLRIPYGMDTATRYLAYPHPDDDILPPLTDEDAFFDEPERALPPAHRLPRAR